LIKSAQTSVESICCGLFKIAPHLQTVNSLRDFEYGLDLKTSMFDEHREEFAIFSSALP
jgi:hypothetical protein